MTLAQAEIACELDVAAGDLGGRQLRAPQHRGERHPRGVVGQHLVADASQIVRMGARTAELPVLGLGRGPAVIKDAADPGIPVRGDRRVGVSRTVHDVRLVAHRGDPGVQSTQVGHQVAGVHVARLEVLAEPDLHRVAVLGVGPGGPQVANRALPGVAVGVDEPREHRAAGAIDDTCSVIVQSRADGLDDSAGDQDVADELSEARVLGQEVRSRDDETVVVCGPRGHASSSFHGLGELGGNRCPSTHPPGADARCGRRPRGGWAAPTPEAFSRRSHAPPLKVGTRQ